MAALTADRELTHKFQAELLGYPIADSAKIYKYSWVCQNASGYAVAAADTSGYSQCVGAAERQYDNTVAGHAAGALTVNCWSGQVFKNVPIEAVVQADVGQSLAYIKDSALLTKSPTNFIVAGLIVGFVDSTHCDVFVPLPIPGSVPTLGGLTATAAELNTLHSVTAGTTAASKALVVDASKELDVLLVKTLTADQALKLTSAASVAFGATMALVVATPKIEIAANHTTSATATVNCAAVAPDGAVLTILIKEGAGTGTVVTTFGTHFKTTGTLTTQSSGTSSITFLGDGTNWNETGRGATLT